MVSEVEYQMDMLMFELYKNTTKPLYEQLYLSIKNAIMSKQIEVGSKLPSKKKLADFLNISQTTIEVAYAQLIAEGFIVSKPRIGFFVENIDEIFEEFRNRQIEIADELKLHPYGLREFSFIDINGYYIRVTEANEES